jgi:hypothetical protein
VARCEKDEMKIEKYSFGSITIAGKEYTKDVIIFPNKVFSPWWREKGHSLSLKDLKEAIDAKPSLLIIGTGAYGVMHIPDETLKKLKEKNIDTVFVKTGEAVKLYNEKVRDNKNVIACLHLTC